MELKDRLEKFLSSEGLTRVQFAESVKVTNASISHILSGRNMPGYDFIINVIAAYPALNIEWLLTGKGEMYKDRLFEAMDDTSGEPIGQAVEQTQVPPTASPAVSPAAISKIVAFFSDGTYKEFY